MKVLRISPAGEPVNVKVTADEPRRHGPYFPRDLVARFLTAPGRRRFIRLEATLVYVRGDDARGFSVVHAVPFRFECDGGSIPRLLWSLIGHPLSGDFVRSCVVHDWLCKLARDVDGAVEVSPDVWKRATRAHADSVFLEALRCEGLGEIRARVMYAGVRLGALWKR